jgi:hypothetical protein
MDGAGGLNGYSTPKNKQDASGDKVEPPACCLVPGVCPFRSSALTFLENILPQPAVLVDNWHPTRTDMPMSILLAIPGLRGLIAYPWTVPIFSAVDDAGGSESSHQDIPSRHIVTDRLNTLLDKRYGKQYTLEVRASPIFLFHDFL